MLCAVELCLVFVLQTVCSWIIFYANLFLASTGTSYSVENLATCFHLMLCVC